jgi:hypothetical protein
MVVRALHCCPVYFLDDTTVRCDMKLSKKRFQGLWFKNGISKRGDFYMRVTAWWRM